MNCVAFLSIAAAPAALMLAVAPAAASQWAVVPAQSSLTFTSEWSGQTVTGRFPRFTVNIRFDPERLAEARVDGVIDLSAATTNDRTVNGSLPGPDWFDVRTSSNARLQLAQITRSKPGHYVARGTLSMRGAAVPVTLAFTLEIKGDTAFMAGQTMLDRRPFGIGMAGDPAASWVAFQVPVRVRIVANRVR